MTGACDKPERKVITAQDNPNNCYYIHFKGNRYFVLCVAQDDIKTEEKCVVYLDIVTGGWWARPLEMYVSEVDKKKYLKIKQKYRFELMKKREAIKAIADFKGLHREHLAKIMRGEAPCIAQHTETGLYILIKKDPDPDINIWWAMPPELAIGTGEPEKRYEGK